MSTDPLTVRQRRRSARADARPVETITTIVLVGVALRGLLLWLVLPLDIQSDEANYLYLALAKERLGIYYDQHRYFWPPVPLATLEVDPCLRHRRAECAASLPGGPLQRHRRDDDALRLAACSAPRGDRGGGDRADLPLGAYTHFLWTETVFLSLLLPALWYFVRAMDLADEGEDLGATRRLLVSGVLFGLALYIKEYVLFLVPALAAVVAFRSRGAGWPEALRRASLPVLAVAVVTLPWTLRNHEVYGRTVVGGATLGENVFVGLNARSMNFDVLPLRKRRADLGLPQIETLARTSFTEVPAGWVPEDRDGNGEIEVRDAGWDREFDAIHAIDRHSSQLRTGLAFAAEHPAWTLRTRLKKWSELVTPLSFFTRHQAMAMYPEGGVIAGACAAPWCSRSPSPRSRWFSGPPATS